MITTTVLIRNFLGEICEPIVKSKLSRLSNFSSSLKGIFVRVLLAKFLPSSVLNIPLDYMHIVYL